MRGYEKKGEIEKAKKRAREKKGKNEKRENVRESIGYLQSSLVCVEGAWSVRKSLYLCCLQSTHLGGTQRNKIT